MLSAKMAAILFQVGWGGDGDSTLILFNITEQDQSLKPQHIFLKSY